jgi:hypothetical protein
LSGGFGQPRVSTARRVAYTLAPLGVYDSNAG